MKATIVGAGAIGCWIAGLLAEAGLEVSLLARGRTLAALRENGLVLRRGGTDHRYPVTASDDPHALPAADYLILATKGQDVPSLASTLAAMTGPATTLVPALNGIPWWFFQVANVALPGTVVEAVDPGGVLAEALGVECILGCVVHASVWTPAPGVAEVNKEDKLIFGEPDGEASPRCQTLCAAFARAGIQADASSRIRHDIWTKLWGNMSMNPLSVLACAETGPLLDDPDVHALVVSMMLEMQELGTRIGLPLEMTPQARMAITRKLGSFKTSMLRDAEAGRALEIAPLTGALVEIAGKVGVPSPCLHAVHGLLRVRARSVG